MLTNHITLSGTTTAAPTHFTSHDYGDCLDFEIFTEDWWEDRQGTSHTMIWPVRLLTPTDIPPGSYVLVEGRLHRWSVGERRDRRPAATGILADKVTILKQADQSESRSSAVRADTQP